MTLAERKLWTLLRSRQLGGYRFRRQMPIGPYIADFCCLQARLIIEVDGGQHADSVTDGHRDAFLHREGFHLLRFWNNDVLANPEGVYEVIVQRLTAGCPHPNLPPQAGGGDDH